MVPLLSRLRLSLFLTLVPAFVVLLNPSATGALIRADNPDCVDVLVLSAGGSGQNDSLTALYVSSSSRPISLFSQHPASA